MRAREVGSDAKVVRDSVKGERRNERRRRRAIFIVCSVDGRDLIPQNGTEIRRLYQTIGSIPKSKPKDDCGLEWFGH